MRVPKRKYVKLQAIAVVALLGTAVRADEPLHQAIDRLIEAKADADGVTVQPVADDAEFLRRVYLDLAGRIPTVAEAEKFLADQDAQKREKLIDALLAGPDYPRHMQELFHTMLMERRGDHAEWTKFLRKAFAQNMHWDELARSILKPPAADENRRGAAYFMTARLISEGAFAPIEVPSLTRDVGRMFAGVDLQCAQCHDHVSIDAYKQRDFQGLHVIFENVETRNEGPAPGIAEKVMTKKKEYMSVFIQQKAEIGPLVPGAAEVEIAVFPMGEEFAVPPDKDKRTPGELKFSPLGELAARLTAKDNEPFRRNIANRLWFVMMGQGLVEPLDLHHVDNPPTHPELLDLLAKEFAAHEFDIRWLLRELALSKTYQRTSVLAGSGSRETSGGESGTLTSSATRMPPRESYALAIEKRLSAEQLFWSALVAAGEVEARNLDVNAAGEKTTLETAIEGDKELGELQKSFVKAFSNPPREPELEFAPSVKEALFVMHDRRLLKLLEPKERNLAQRAAAITDTNQLADAIFLAVLSRPPTDEDRADVKAYLEKHADRRPKAIAELIWSLMASTEFCVNH
jgi:hypothetical protein